ncbi:MAG: YwaF family protein [Solirubrobacteraceae bacterium]
MRQFSDQHLAALAVLVVGAAGSVWAARRHPGAWIVWFSRALALAIMAGWVGEYIADLVLGQWTARYSLPLQLTDAVSAASILALLTGAPLLVELTYYWALTASLQAALTPDLAQAFPSIFYFTYFAYHVGAILAACFLVFGCRRYPRPGAVWRVYGVTLVVAGVAGVGDLLTGGNYLYLHYKPAHSSLLNLLGPWPWYIPATAALGLVMLLVLAAITHWVRLRIDPTPEPLPFL